jgi:hypothetical protein
VSMIFDNKIYMRMEERKLLKPMRKQKLFRGGKWRKEICYILKNCIRTSDKKNGWHLLWELMYVCMYVPTMSLSQVEMTWAVPRWLYLETIFNCEQYPS